MKTIALNKEKIYSGNLLLVNAAYPLKNIMSKDLIPADMRFPKILMKRDAVNVLQLILGKISSNGTIVPVSGYRSAEEQTAIFSSSLKNNGKEFTGRFVALPNHSEHQTGLAIDLGLNKENIDFICPDFPYEGVCDEFRRTAPDYGFIERYAKGKEEITGISHEPWHFRYVGYPHSKIICENGFSLEEYIQFIKSYRDSSRYSYKQGYETEAEVYFVPADTDAITITHIPSQSVYQISGNNIDGFIVTVWRKTNEQKKELPGD
ncbi:MAG: M15 family metallopeptidase [Lachnospiraceae bacterium]